MANSNHTPGPWRAGRPDMINHLEREPESYGKNVYTDDDRAGTHFTGKKLPLAVAEALGCTAEEAHANAQLIAAAPQMMEALHCIEGLLENHPDLLTNTLTSAAHKVARKALAAARGEGDGV